MMKYYTMMPLDKNVNQDEALEKGWKKEVCPKCGRECWGTNAYQNAKKQGKIKFNGLCTECALKLMIRGDHQ